MKDIAAIIPARGGSKRLAGKNIYPFFGKPLIVWSIEACRRSRYISNVFVSSDNAKILKTAEEHGARIIPRPAALADDVTPKIEAIRHGEKWIEDNTGLRPEILVSVQANSPEIQGRDMDAGIEMMLAHDRWEVFSIDRHGLMNGAFRILRRDCLYNNFLSAHMGVIEADYIDVHTREDLEQIKARYSGRDAFIRSRK